MGVVLCCLRVEISMKENLSKVRSEAWVVNFNLIMQIKRFVFSIIWHLIILNKKMEIWYYILKFFILWIGFFMWAIKYKVKDEILLV